MQQFCFQLNLERLTAISNYINKKQLIALSNQILLLQQLAEHEDIILKLNVKLYRKQQSDLIKVNCYLAYMPNSNKKIIEKQLIIQNLESSINNQTQIQNLLGLLQNYVSEDLLLEIQIQILIENLDYYFNNQFPMERVNILKTVMQNKNKLYLVYSYTLDFEKDAITNKTIKFPILLFENDNLVFPPLFQDQQTYLQSIFQNKTKIDNEIFEQNVPVLMIYSLYEYFIKMNYQTKIMIYPQLGNYAIFINDKQYFYNEQHLMQFFFRNQRHNSNQLVNLINQNKFGQIELFQVSENQLQEPLIMININDDFIKRIRQNSVTLQWYIDKYISDINITFQDLEKSHLLQILSNLQNQLIDRFRNYQDNQIWISKKPYPYIFSTECYDISTPFKHQLEIEYDLLDFTQGRVIKEIKCKDCNTKIIDYSTIFVEEKFYKFYQKTQKLFEEQQHNLHPFLFLFPLTLEKLNILEKQNTWWKLMLQYDNETLINYYYPFNIINYNEDLGIKMQDFDNKTYFMENDTTYTLEGNFNKKYWEQDLSGRRGNFYYQQINLQFKDSK